MANGNESSKVAASSPYLPETRTVIVCWMMVSTYSIIMVLAMWGGPKGESAQLLNTLLGMYVGTGLITSITWWMGSAKGSDANNKMQDKMADAIRPALSVEPPAVISWWTLLTPEEQAAIAASPDADVKMFAAAAKVKRATPELLDKVVAAGLLTPERAAAIQAA